MTLTEVLAVWGIVLNERQAQQLLEEMLEADDEIPSEWNDTPSIGTASVWVADDE